MPNVSSRWPSKLGGSAAPTKTSSPPERGLSWAGAGPAVTRTATTAKEVRIISDRLVRCPMGTSEKGKKVPRTISHARTRTPGRAGSGRSSWSERLLHPGVQDPELCGDPAAVRDLSEHGASSLRGFPCPLERDDLLDSVEVPRHGVD